MKRTAVAVSNEVHGTRVTLRAMTSDYWLHLSPRQVRRARGILCGVSGCTCGGILGQRPGQGWESTQAGGAVRFRAEAVDG